MSEEALEILIHELWILFIGVKLTADVHELIVILELCQIEPHAEETAIIVLAVSAAIY